jgi:hypothetical protein
VKLDRINRGGEKPPSPRNEYSESSPDEHADQLARTASPAHEHIQIKPEERAT